MYTFWLLMSFIVPFVMVCLQSKWHIIHVPFDILAIATFIFASNLVSFSVYNVIEDDAVFMTTIHGIFLDPIFLICGAYLIIYTSYRLMQTLK